MAIDNHCFYCHQVTWHGDFKDKCACDKAMKADYDAWVKEQTDKLKGDMMRELEIVSSRVEWKGQKERLFVIEPSIHSGEEFFIRFFFGDESNGGVFVNKDQAKELRDYLNEFLGETQHELLNKSRYEGVSIHDKFKELEKRNEVLERVAPEIAMSNKRINSLENKIKALEDRLDRPLLGCVSQRDEELLRTYIFRELVERKGEELKTGKQIIDEANLQHDIEQAKLRLITASVIQHFGADIEINNKRIKALEDALQKAVNSGDKQVQWLYDECQLIHNRVTEIDKKLDGMDKLPGDQSVIFFDIKNRIEGFERFVKYTEKRLNNLYDKYIILDSETVKHKGFR